MEQLTTHKREVNWDPNNRKEVEDAKKIYQQARRERREVTLLGGAALEHFNPECASFWVLPPKMTDTQLEARIYDETGDRRLVWDSQRHNEIQDAFKMFNDYLQKGWRAYAISDKGDKSRRIYKFDAEFEEVYFDEKSSKERLEAFTKSFKKIEVTPKTRPG